MKERKIYHSRGGKGNGLHRVLFLATLVGDIKRSVSESKRQYLTRQLSITNA